MVQSWGSILLTALTPLRNTGPKRLPCFFYYERTYCKGSIPESEYGLSLTRHQICDCLIWTSLSSERREMSCTVHDLFILVHLLQQPKWPPSSWGCPVLNDHGEMQVKVHWLLRISCLTNLRPLWVTFLGPSAFFGGGSFSLLES